MIAVLSFSSSSTSGGGSGGDVATAIVPPIHACTQQITKKEISLYVKKQAVKCSLADRMTLELLEGNEVEVDNCTNSLWYKKI